MRKIRWGPAWAAGVVVVVFLGFCASFYTPGRGFTALLMLGEHQHERFLPELRALGLDEMPDSLGYDGQYYAQLAMSPDLSRPSLAGAIDNLPYRARRMLFSWIAWAVALGDPERALHVFAVQNIVCWLGLAGLLWRWLPLENWGNLGRWLGVMGAFGWGVSVRGSLVDGPSLLLLAGGVALIETGRRWSGAAVLGLAGLGKETSLGAAGALLPTGSGDRREWGRALGSVALAAAPLCAWLGVLAWWLGTAGAGGEGNFAWPLAGFAVKARETLAQFLAEEWSSDAKWELLSLLALGTQAAFLTLRWRPRERWWRVGVMYGALFLVLGPAVWAGYPGAAARVLLPMTLAFNLLVPRGGMWWLVLVLGNASIVSSWGLPRPPVRIDHVIEGATAGPTTPDGAPALTVRFDDTWFRPERSLLEYWRWSGGDGSIRLRNARSAPLGVEVSFALRSNTARSVTVRQGSVVLWQGRLEPGVPHEVAALRADLPPGETVWRLTSDAPGQMRGGSDLRTLAFSVRDLRVRLLPEPPH